MKLHHLLVGTLPHSTSSRRRVVEEERVVRCRDLIHNLRLCLASEAPVQGAHCKDSALDLLGFVVRSPWHTDFVVVLAQTPLRYKVEVHL